MSLGKEELLIKWETCLMSLRYGNQELLIKVHLMFLIFGNKIDPALDTYTQIHVIQIIKDAKIVSAKLFKCLADVLQNINQISGKKKTTVYFYFHFLWSPFHLLDNVYAVEDLCWFPNHPCVLKKCWDRHPCEPQQGTGWNERMAIPNLCLQKQLHP